MRAFALIMTFILCLSTVSSASFLDILPAEARGAIDYIAKGALNVKKLFEGEEPKSKVSENNHDTHISNNVEKNHEVPCNNDPNSKFQSNGLEAEIIRDDDRPKVVPAPSIKSSEIPVREAEIIRDHISPYGVPAPEVPVREAEIIRDNVSPEVVPTPAIKSSEVPVREADIIRDDGVPAPAIEPSEVPVRDVDNPDDELCPSLHFEIECNHCTCQADGKIKNAACTKMLCENREEPIERE